MDTPGLDPSTTQFKSAPDVVQHVFTRTGSQKQVLLAPDRLSHCVKLFCIDHPLAVMEERRWRRKTTDDIQASKCLLKLWACSQFQSNMKKLTRALSWSVTQCRPSLKEKFNYTQPPSSWPSFNCHRAVSRGEVQTFHLCWLMAGSWATGIAVLTSVVKQATSADSNCSVL